MPMQLVVADGPDKGRRFLVEDGESFLIGRGRESQTQLTDAKVSRTHCLLCIDRGTPLLEDCGSAGGTFVNDSAVQQVQLAPGDIIRIGDSRLRFEFEAIHGQSTVLPKGTAQTVPVRNDRSLSHLIGSSIHDCEIEHVIATGSTGTVFRAVNRSKQNQHVAVKVLWPDISADKQEMDRFLRAMKTMYPVRHPNIVRIHNAGRKSGHVFVIMEYIDGESLARMIDRIGAAGMLDWRNSFHAAVDIARALEAAADHKIVHRNITPRNILRRTADKRTLLGDLMLAKALEGTMATQITRPGQMVGELPYASPERTVSESRVDQRSDIYSLGATCYALLTGRPPFEAPSLPELVRKIRDDEPTEPKQFQLSVADLFQDAVLKMLAKRPEDRYQHPTQLLVDLERIGRYQGLEIH